MTQLFINNFSTTLSQTLGVADTGMTLTSAAGLPVLTGTDFYLLTLFRLSGVEESGHEVVKVTARTNNYLTIERAFEGAAASQFAIGDRVQARVTAKSMTAKQDALVVITISTTNQTAVAGNHYILTNVAATTLTLPATPASNDTVWVTPTNGLTTNVIGRGGSTIMGVAEDMTLDNANATVELRYLASTWRLI